MIRAAFVVGAGVGFLVWLHSRKGKAFIQGVTATGNREWFADGCKCMVEEFGGGESRTYEVPAAECEARAVALASCVPPGPGEE